MGDVQTPVEGETVVLSRDEEGKPIGGQVLVARELTPDEVASIAAQEKADELAAARAKITALEARIVAMTDEAALKDAEAAAREGALRKERDQISADARARVFEHAEAIRRIERECEAKLENAAKAQMNF